MRMHKLLLAALLMAVLAVSLGVSNIDPAQRWAWTENAGWWNWRHDRPDPGDGVEVNATFLSGMIWAENVGWINLGDGSPFNGLYYANVDGSDFGVNRDPITGQLSGMAWGENIGWVNFNGGALASPPQPARIDLPACRLRGYAWGENIGWVNLDDADAHVALMPSACRRLGDMDCDGDVDAVDAAPFVLCLVDPAGYQVQYPSCDPMNADLSQDGRTDGADAQLLVRCLLLNACP